MALPKKNNPLPVFNLWGLLKCSGKNGMDTDCPGAPSGAEVRHSWLIPTVNIAQHLKLLDKSCTFVSLNKHIRAASWAQVNRQRHILLNLSCNKHEVSFNSKAPIFFCNCLSNVHHQKYQEMLCFVI